jgi:hypothetical protein
VRVDAIVIAGAKMRATDIRRPPTSSNTPTLPPEGTLAGHISFFLSLALSRMRACEP